MVTKHYDFATDTKTQWRSLAFEFKNSFMDTEDISWKLTAIILVLLGGSWAFPSYCTA